MTSLFKRMSNGEKAIGLFFVITYFIPMVGVTLFREELLSTYKLYPLTTEAVATLCAIFALYFVLCRLRFSLFRPIDFSALKRYIDFCAQLYARSRLAIALAEIALGLVALYTQSAGYRYMSEGIVTLDAGTAIFLLPNIVLNVVITIDVFYCIFIAHEQEHRPLSRRHIEAILLALALILSANGTFSLFIGLAALLHALSPGRFHGVLFGEARERRSWAQTLAWGAILVFALMVAWYFGTLIKLSSSRDVGEIVREVNWLNVLGLVGTDLGLADLLYYFLERYSIFYHSFLYTLAATPEELRHGAVSVLSFPLHTLFYRIDFLLGGAFDVTRPEVAAISRLNYELLTVDPISDRAGSAPGLIASFNYVFAFPFNIILCALFLRWLTRVIDVLLWRNRGESLNLFGLVMLLIFLQTVFQSPFDVLIVFDDAAIYLGLLFMLYANERIAMKAARSFRPAITAPGSATGMAAAGPQG